MAGQQGTMAGPAELLEEVRAGLEERPAVDSAEFAAALDARDPVARWHIHWGD